MSDFFTKFYSNYIQTIHDFLNSSSDILFINGFSGSGKSSVLKAALKTYDKDILTFRHLCFKGTVIDDFLLSFYDSFINNAIKGRTVLKKNPEEGFMQKVSFYFKNLDCPAVVVIDNYEIVSNDESITDFLLHISSFENVKIVIISKETNSLLSENKDVSVVKLTFDKINIFEFEEMVKSRFENIDADGVQTFYDACDGYELYFRMTMNYLSALNMQLSEFLKEFTEKGVSFSDFIIEKQVSLIPSIYFPLLENLAVIRHNVSPRFIEAYSLGETRQLSYLISKFAVSEFFGTYYIKAYLRKYFLNNLSLQDKINIPSKIISIYENELKKSPKDRLLRLSRESIRNRISLLNESMPKIQKVNPAPSFNYVAQAINSNPHWFITGANNEHAKDTGKVFHKKEIQKQNAEYTPNAFEKAISTISSLEAEYRFEDAIAQLLDLKAKAGTLGEKITVYSKLAINLTKVNNNNSALTYLRDLCRFCLDENDLENFALYRIETGKIFKKMYAFSRAKACFEEVKAKKGQITDKTLAIAMFSLGEIFELENNFESALKEYNQSFDLILNSAGEKDVFLPEICYKTGLIYDENGYLEEALSEYRKSVKFALISKNDIYLTKCYTNSGIILADMGETDDALSYLEYAYSVSKDTLNHVDTCYIARNIAKIYKSNNQERAFEYFQDALEFARLSENAFEVAISLLELGDFYYDLKQNEQALICYFQAKNTLGAGASKENLEKVVTRINDMKIKLGDYIFKGMQQLYDPN